MNNKLITISILVSVLLVAVSFVYRVGLEGLGKEPRLILSPEEFVLPIKWGDLGEKLVETGVIDIEKFEALYARRGGLSEKIRNFLEGNGDALAMTQENAGEILNLLWAFGLSNKNRILEESPMTDERYGGPQYFASTGGWTLAKGDVMEHYSRHPFVILTREQQELVEKVSKNIYRPCCNNSAYFPDCNHGMAMLGLLELMASQGLNEAEMYNAALRVNSYWFPDTYATIAQYLALEGKSLNEANPKKILGADFSSVSGYQRILAAIPPSKIERGVGCGV